jgi:dihydropteroate synthase
MTAGNFFRKKYTINVKGKLIDLGSPKIMGIINLTPDSFYAGSRKTTVDTTLQQAGQMLSEGADFLDLGAYSSRPGATDISIQEETDRLLPAVEAIAANFKEAVISIDTFRAPVAEAAIKAGAHIVNDISGGQLDDAMYATIARLQVPYILMHMKGTPQTMVQQAQYDDVFNEVLAYFADRYGQVKALGVHDVIIDPGFGFAKTAEQGYELLRKMRGFDMLQLPVLAGVSRKRMVYGVTGGSAEDALIGTTVLHTLALNNGANILRVHDVKEAADVLKIWKMYHIV